MYENKESKVVRFLKAEPHITDWNRKVFPRSIFSPFTTAFARNGGLCADCFDLFCMWTRQIRSIGDRHVFSLAFVRNELAVIHSIKCIISEVWNFSDAKRRLESRNDGNVICFKYADANQYCMVCAAGWLLGCCGSGYAICIGHSTQKIAVGGGEELWLIDWFIWLED